jgi:hypothetical protein
MYTLEGSRDYRLEAVLGTVVATAILGADSDEDATMDAIGVILDNAYADKKGPWAKGAITLTNPNGEVIHTMDAK